MLYNDYRNLLAVELKALTSIKVNTRKKHFLTIS